MNKGSSEGSDQQEVKFLRNRLIDGDDRGQSEIRYRRVGQRVVERDQGVPVSSRWGD